MTNTTAYTEVLARLLCAADVHVHEGDHPSWQQLRVAEHGRGQDDYRKAARWLAARLTVTPAVPAVVEPPVDQAVLDRVREIVRRLAAHAVGFQDVLDDSDRDPWAKTVRADIAALRRLVGETPAAAPELQVWPLRRVLTEVRCGSKDWPWENEWADLDRRHAETGYLGTLEAQIRENGITMPVLIGSDGRLWDGHHRLRIAVRAGIEYVPVEIVQPAAAPQDGARP